MATRYVSMDVVGFENVKRQFSLLPLRVRDKVMKNAVKQGQVEFEKRLRWQAPREFGWLQHAIGKDVWQGGDKSVTLSKSGARRMWIPMPKQVRWTKTGRINPGIYFNVLNKGVHAGKHAGWVDRVYNQAKNVAQQRLETFVIRGLRREGKKLGMKTV